MKWDFAQSVFLEISHSFLQSWFGTERCTPFTLHTKGTQGVSGGASGKESTCKTGDMGPIPGSGRSSGGGHGNPLQYSCLENPMDRGAWWATVHGVTKSQEWSNWACMQASTHLSSFWVRTLSEFIGFLPIGNRIYLQKPLASVLSVFFDGIISANTYWSLNTHQTVR